jgi:hypothetical protein
MAKKIVFPGVFRRSLPVVSGVVSDEVVKVGALIGVAVTSRDADGNATVEFGPEVTVTAAAATYGVGDTIYGHASGGGAVTARVQLIDKTSTTGTVLGYAMEGKTLAAEGPLKIQLTLV